MGGRAQALKNTMPALILGTVQSVAYTATSAASTNAFTAGVTVLRVVATTDCHIRFAATPTAVTTDSLLVANIPEYFSIPDDGVALKIAAIRTAANGTLFVTEVS